MSKLWSLTASYESTPRSSANCSSALIITQIYHFKLLRKCLKICKIIMTLWSNKLSLAEFAKKIPGHGLLQFFDNSLWLCLACFDFIRQYHDLRVDYLILDCVHQSGGIFEPIRGKCPLLKAQVSEIRPRDRYWVNMNFYFESN